MRFCDDIRPFYAKRAEVLLESWICGDKKRLQSELNCIANFSPQPYDNVDHYFAELLKLVVRGMQHCPDLYAQRMENPVVGIYVDVLHNLSNRVTSASQDIKPQSK